MPNYSNGILRMHDQPATSHAIKVKEFDEQGITFYHRLPLVGRRAMLVLESPRVGPLTTEVDLTWCHFNRRGQYTSGGRIVRQIGKTA